ncbi:MAG: fibronectin type III domain-containing protein [bacterium]|nr:fibronectin type III domain-containing protein [bacterium]
MNKKIKKLFIASAVSLSIAAFAFVGVFAVKAATKAVMGWAWSDTIGWIQFAPDFGGVFIDNATGDFSGYAWSENIGWIDFAPTAETAPDGNPGGAFLSKSTGAVTGWAKAVAGDAASGWDGWISMSGTASDGSSYGVEFNQSTSNFSGWAWASNVVGWISFSGSGYAVSLNPECSDGLDNDGDTLTDFPDDPGCVGPNDNSESDDNVPVDPSGLTALAGTGGACETIALAWTDNADNEDGYKIERGVDGVTFPDTVADLAANSTNYTDTGIAAGDYYYRVYAYNAAGSSGYSNVAGDTAVACPAVQDYTVSYTGGSLYATIVSGRSVTTNTITLSITGDVNFTSDVTLSLGSVTSSNGIEVTSSFVGNFNPADGIIPYDYTSGVDFSLNVDGSIPNGLYIVTINATGGGIDRFVSIPLNVETLEPGWEEI